MATPTVSSVTSATSGAVTTLSNLMSKFLDNVNAGKFVTDIGPGLALTVPLLMLIAVLTGGQFLPLQQAPHLRTQYREIYGEVERRFGLIHARLPAEFQNEIGARSRWQLPDPTDPLPSRWERLDRHSADAIAAMNKAHAKAEQHYIGESTRENRDIADRLEADKKRVEKELTVVGLLRPKLVELKQQYAEATGVTKNLEGWEPNLTLIAGLSLVFGVVVSQAARFVFFEFLFRFPFLPQWRALRASLPGFRPTAALQRQRVKDRRYERLKSKSTLLKQLSPAYATAYQDLVTNHLRYAEGAVNMAVPVFLFGWVYPLFTAPFLDDGPPGGGHAEYVRIASWLTVFCMIGSGWCTYLRFRAKEREWLSRKLL
jgi:hypothetical protein